MSVHTKQRQVGRTGSRPGLATRFDSFLSKTYERRKDHFPRLFIAGPERGCLRRVWIGRHRLDRIEFDVLVGVPAAVARADWPRGLQMPRVDVPGFPSED